MSINQVSDSFKNSDSNVVPEKKSGLRKAAGLIGGGLKWGFQTAGSLTTKAISYLPAGILKENLLQKIDRLSTEEYQELLEFISSGNCPKSLYIALLKEMVSHWEEVQTLVKTDNPPVRLMTLVGTMQQSPLLLCHMLRQFSQSNLWQYLKKDLIAWPVENWDETVIRNGVKESGLTIQFDKDCPRSHYVVEDKEGAQHLFPPNYPGDKVKDLASSLKELSVFKDMKSISFPIQEALTQTTAVSSVLTPVWFSLNSPLPPPDFSQRTFVLEEGDHSCFCMKIREKLVFPQIISFEYSYQFKISKVSDHEWSAELLSLSYLEPKVGENCEVLFTTCQPAEDSVVFSSLFDTLTLNLVDALQAAALCEDPESLKRIEKQIQKLWTSLSTQFDSEFWKTSSTVKKLDAALANTAKTNQGQTILADIQQRLNSLK